MNDITAETQTGLIWEYVKGFHAVHLVAAGVKLGLFEKLDAADDGLETADLAEALGLHAPYVDVWCKTACAYGLLDAAGEGRFRLAPFIDELLVQSGNPRLLAPYFTTAVDHLGADMARYPEFFKTGATYTYQEHGAEFSEAVARLTAGFHTVVARRILKSLPGVGDRLEAGGRVLDMGCGAAGLLVKIAEAFPESTCVGVDVDAHGIEAARRAIEERGLAGRVTVELAGGGAIAETGACDVVTMIEVLHEIPVAARPPVMAAAHWALKPGGVLVIIDETYPSSSEELRDPAYGFAVQTAYNELIWGNVVPTREDQEALLSAAGFVNVQRSAIGGIFTLITADKADGA